MLGIITTVIYPADLDKFNELLRSKTVFVEITTIANVFQRLVDFYTGKDHPLEKPSSSSTGKSETARTSKAVVSRPVSNKRRSL
jgi:hypothetical protein